MQVDTKQWQQYQKLEGKLEAAKRDMLVLTQAFIDHRAQAAAKTLVGSATCLCPYKGCCLFWRRRSWPGTTM